MNSHSRRLGTLLAALGLVISATAQDAAQVKLGVLAFPPKGGHPALKLVTGDKTSIDVEASSSSIAGPYEVPAMAEWTFVQSTGEGEPVKVASCKAGASGRQLVVLVRSGEGGKYGAFALDADPKKFGEKQFCLVNLTPEELAAEIGGKRVLIAPGKHAQVQPAEDQGKELCHAAIFRRKAQAWKPFFTTNWPLKEKTRGWVFLYRGPDGKKLLVHAVRDST